MNPDLADSSFTRRLHAAGPTLDDRAYRRLVLAYASLYHEVYYFDALDHAFSELNAVAGEPSRLGERHPGLLAQVREAMADYCISLNEVASALHRLLDPAPLTAAQTLTCISHLWNARACNEDPSEFCAREDLVLCELLAKLRIDPVIAPSRSSG